MIPQTTGKPARDSYVIEYWSAFTEKWVIAGWFLTDDPKKADAAYARYVQSSPSDTYRLRKELN